ncbi:MAG: phosphatase PAP2 family protein [Leptolyngbya foveolarum]|uniref:Phosphatase PAP2 family protein n=1 Tax=Leptolyngbya foveolarum TaxID=47253 RepID=A0A2W4U4Q1_9CYAN|nr:MAG: phosphatase PAP2 family protein [Leptolyngbya foveolarum]
MQSLLSSLAHGWKQKAYPTLSSFIAFFGVAWLGVCIATVYILAELSDEVLEQEAFALDETILLHIRRFANPLLDKVMVFITNIGDPHTVVPLTVIAFVFLLVNRQRLAATFFAINAAGGVALSYFLKLAFSKPRPQLWNSAIEEVTYSYPSGHALGSMVIYGFLSYVLAKMYPRYSAAIYTFAVLMIVSIGFSRLYLGVHWPTDILGGYGIGFLWITACISLLRLRQRGDAF